MGDNIFLRLAAEQDAADLRAENKRLKAWMKRATAALIKVRPLGGSELFMRVGEENYADPEWCGRAIEEMRDRLHKERVENIRLQRQVEGR